MNVLLFAWLLMNALLLRVMKDLDEEKKQRGQLEVRNQRLADSLNEVKGQVQHGDYKIENYDRVKRF